MSHGFSSNLTMLTPAQLALTGTTPASARTITSADVTIAAGMAFDLAGNLWVTNFGGSVAKFTAAQLAITGSPAATVVISGDTTVLPALVNPVQVNFDAKGVMWVLWRGASNVATLAGYTPDQIAATGAPVPAYRADFVNGGLNLAFFALQPPTPWLPLER
jgi:hypothetical protein